MAVYYRCKVCGEDHRSPIGLDDEQSFEASTLEYDSFVCPHTHQMETYAKGDMYWKDEPGG
jgi:hypothetical protein